MAIKTIKDALECLKRSDDGALRLDDGHPYQEKAHSIKEKLTIAAASLKA